ncbi:unnamed protein product, partial [Pylaiella littoralis]
MGPEGETDPGAPETNPGDAGSKSALDKKGGVGDAATDHKTSGWVRVHAAANRAADNFFYRLGYWVATHPKLTLLLNLAFVVLCSVGFVNFRVVTDGEILWVPANSLSKQHELIILNYFREGSDYALMLLESAVEGGNVLTMDAVDMIWELNARVLALETESGNRYTDLCTTELDGGACKQPFRGITRFWGNDLATYEASVTSDADVLAAISVSNFPDGQAVLLQAVFGNSLTYDDATGGAVSARICMQSYELGLTANDDEEFREVREWEKLFHDLMEGIITGEEADGAGGGEDDIAAAFNLRYFTGRSMDDALAASVNGETHLFVVTYFIMVVFITINLGKCGAGAVRRRSWLGMSGVLIIVFAGVAAYGLNSGFGVPFTTLSQILPFILIGIGVDDMAVIVSSFDHTDPTLPVEARMALAIKRCGVSITYTSMTNFFAFMLGSATSLPAVEYFCLYAGTAILFDFILQASRSFSPCTHTPLVTGFVACLTLDANRQIAGRMDWLCCFKGDARYNELPEASDGTQRAAALPPGVEGEGIDDSIGHHHGAKAMPLTTFGRFCKEKYTPFILSATGKVLVLLGSAGLFVAGVYGATQATQGFDPIDLAPDDHHAKQYTDMARVYDLEIDTQYVPLSIYSLAVDYPDVGVQAQIQATDELMADQRFVIGPVRSWLSDFIDWTANSTVYSANLGTSGGYPVYEDRATFYTALSQFTQDGDNARFESDLVYDTGGNIEASKTLHRIGMYLIDMTSTDNAVKALKDSREVQGESTLDPPPMAFSGYFILTEQFLVIYDELMANYIMALVAVAVFSVFVLGNFKIVALVCFTVVIIDVELLGFVYHWGLDVNSLTVIELIMAVGLVVDYMVHIVHYFLHQDPNSPKDVRIADGLGEIGPSVVVGAATSFVGIMPMVFAKNHVFRVFLKMFIIIIGFGFFHGVCFIPVALSMLPL